MAWPATIGVAGVELLHCVVVDGWGWERRNDWVCCRKLSTGKAVMGIRDEGDRGLGEASGLPEGVL